MWNEQDPKRNTKRKSYPSRGLHKRICLEYTRKSDLKRNLPRGVRGPRTFTSSAWWLDSKGSISITHYDTNACHLPFGFALGACGASLRFRPELFPFCSPSSSKSSSSSTSSGYALLLPFLPPASSPGFCSHLGQNHSPSGTSDNGGSRHSRW